MYSVQLLLIYFLEEMMTAMSLIWIYDDDDHDDDEKENDNVDNDYNDYDDSAIISTLHFCSTTIFFFSFSF